MPVRNVGTITTGKVFDSITVFGSLLHQKYLHATNSASVLVSTLAGMRMIALLLRYKALHQTNVQA